MTATSLPPRPATTGPAGPFGTAARGRFDALRARIRRAITTETAATLLIALVGFAAATFVIDRNLRLEVAVRAVLLAAFGVFVGVQVLRRFVRPMSYRLDDDEMALAVERHSPGLRQALISSLQFERALVTGRVVESTQLMQAVVADVGGRLDAVRFGEALDARRIRKHGALVAAALAAFVGWGIFDGSSLKLWAMRNLGLSAVEWPRYTQFEFVGAEGGAIRLPQGDPFTAQVHVASGPVPDQVFLRYRFKSGDEGVEPMSRTGDHDFTWTIPAVIEDAVISAEGGDGLTDPLRIVIVERPRIEDVVLKVTFPEYMGKEPELVPPTEGEIRMLRGSQLSFSARSHKPIVDAFATLDDATLPLTKDPDEHAFRGTLSPKTGGLLVFNVIDKDQLGAGSPPKILLRVVEDKPPTIDFKLQGISSLITSQARIPGDLKVKDDFGIRSVAAVHRLLDDSAPTKGPDDKPLPEVPFSPIESIFGDPLPPGSVRYETTASVDLKQLNTNPDKEDDPANTVRPGMLLSLRYMAHDNFGPGEAHETSGEILTFRVVTRDKLLEELRRRQVEQRQELERIRDDEQAALLTLREILNPKSNDERASRARGQIQALSRQQRTLGRRVAFVGDMYRRILLEYENNRMWEAAKRREVEGLTSIPLESLARDAFPATAKQIADYSDSGDDAVKQSAVEGCADILMRLEAIIRIMEQAETLAALLEQLRGVIKHEDSAIRAVEKQLDEEAQKLLKDPASKDPAKADPSKPDQPKPPEKPNTDPPKKK